MNKSDTDKLPWRIFYAYADADIKFVQALDRQLSPLRSNGMLVGEPRWEISGGTLYEEAVDRELELAHIVLLFVSPDFMAESNLQNKYVPRALERHESDGVIVVPVLLRPVYWKESSFGHLVALPQNDRPVNTWTIRDEAFHAIAEGIRQLINKSERPRPSSLLDNVKQLPKQEPPPLEAKNHKTSRTKHVEVGHLIQRYDGHSSRVYTVAWSPQGTKIASGGENGSIQVWEAETGHLSQMYREQVGGFPLNQAYIVAWSRDGRYIASGASKGGIQIWNADSGQLMTKYTQHHPGIESVYFLAWSPDGQKIASTRMSDTQAHIWNPKTGQQQQKVKLHSFFAVSSPGAITWSPDGQQLAIGWDNTISCYAAANSRKLMTYKQHKSYILAIQWLQNQRYIISCDNKQIHIWDRETQETVLAYISHRSAIRNFALSPDNHYVASCGQDRTVHVWETKTGEQQYIYEGHRDIVTSVSWSPDGTRIASASNDGSVHVWQAPE